MLECWSHPKQYLLLHNLGTRRVFFLLEDIAWPGWQQTCGCFSEKTTSAYCSCSITLFKRKIMTLGGWDSKSNPQSAAVWQALSYQSHRWAKLKPPRIAVSTTDGGAAAPFFRGCIIKVNTCPLNTVCPWNTEWRELFSISPQSWMKFAASQ